MKCAQRSVFHRLHRRGNAAAAVDKHFARAFFHRHNRRIAEQAAAHQQAGHGQLLDEQRHRLVLGAAPGLPAFFNLSSHGHDLDALQGVHGIAAQALRGGQRVIVADLHADAQAQGTMELAWRAQLQSCWAEPVRGGSGKLLGVMMAYHRQPTLPGAAHLARLSEAAHLAGMAIEQAQVAAAQLRHGGRTIDGGRDDQAFDGRRQTLQLVAEAGRIAGRRRCFHAAARRALLPVRI